ncbi:MAG: hypothetical protein ACKV2T_25725 [Kofleriaceae bacterium]
MRVALVVAVAGIASPAFAEDVAHDLAKARELEAALDYAGALRIVDTALARGGSDTFQYVELHLLGGKLAAGLDRAAEAEAHYARVLALRPNTALPDGTSPKLTGPFDAAKAKSVPLVIRVTEVRGLVTLVPSADPLGLVAGIAVAVVDGAGAHRDVIDRRSTRIALPAGTTAIEVTALDADGHRIWSGPPPTPVVIVDRPLPITEKRSWIARWPTWAIVTGVALGVGGVSAWRVKVAQDDFDRLRAEPEEHDFSELEAIERRGDRWALATNIAFGAAIVTGVVTTILVVKGGEPAAVGVTATGSSAGVGISGRF